MLHARTLALDIQAGRLTSAAVLEMCLEAISAKEPEIGAFVALDEETARRKAAERPRGPLFGLPVGVKDIIDTRDLPTQYGSPIYAGHRPAADAPIVRQVARAGGILLGKTVTTEFAHLFPGKTRNPHRPTHTPGGSSSGSAAAVAAGMLPLAIGTQTGGSVIRPAAFCGVTGYKPTFRNLPTLGMKTFSWHLDTMGVFAARVQDAAHFVAALTGRDLDIGDQRADAPRIGVVRTARAASADAAAHAALDAAASGLSRAGARVHDLDLPEELEAADGIHGAIQDFEAWIALADEFDRARERLSPGLRAHLEAAAGLDVETYDTARRLAKRARQRLGDVFCEVDALITFAAPGAAPPCLDTTGSPVFNRLWTLMGTPCISVPDVRDSAGMPVGVQVVGRFGRDRDALLVAALLERVLG
ncbi:MAG: amidase [Pseudomonadota bacterium]